MTRINSGESDYAPAVSRTRTEIFLTRQNTRWNILPLPSIMVARRKHVSDPFGDPHRIMAIEGWAESPALSLDERSLYYHLKVGDRFEIWRVTR
jgi:hypothetical protein